jgi:hypothetical protein
MLDIWGGADLCHKLVFASNDAEDARVLAGGGGRTPAWMDTALAVPPSGGRIGVDRISRNEETASSRGAESRACNAGVTRERA